MEKKKSIKCLGLAIMLGVNLACSPVTTTLAPLEKQASIKVVLAESKGLRRDVDGLESVGRQAGKGALGGAGAGFYVGAGCGPFFFICSPVFAVAGGALGAVGGSVYGGVIALPEEKEEQFNAIIEQSFTQETPAETLEKSFLRKVGTFWKVESENPDLAVEIRIDNFTMNQYHSDNLAIKLEASFVASYPHHRCSHRSCQGKDKLPSTKRYQFNYLGSRYHVDHFIDEDGEAFRNELNKGMASVAEQMLSVIQVPPSKGSSSNTGFLEAVLGSSADIGSFKMK